jgi:hypothetical protein
MHYEKKLNHIRHIRFLEGKEISDLGSSRQKKDLFSSLSLQSKLAFISVQKNSILVVKCQKKVLSVLVSSWQKKELFSSLSLQSRLAFISVQKNSISLVKCQKKVPSVLAPSWQKKICFHLCLYKAN